MKFAFVLLLLLDVPHSKGQQKIEAFGQISLKVSFPPFCVDYDKYCCRLYPGQCNKVLDSKGYTCDLLKGRVTKTVNDTWIEFKIWNAQLADAGFYRCLVLGTSIYEDFYIEISEPSSRRNPLPPLLTSTIKPSETSETSRTLPDAAGASLDEEHSSSPSVPWSFGLLLAAIVSTAIMIVISAVVTVVCCRVKAKNKCGEILSDSSKHTIPEVSGVVYTTVDFKPYQEPTELYANLQMHRSRAPDADSSKDQAGTVEYSTLAVSRGMKMTF